MMLNKTRLRVRFVQSNFLVNKKYLSLLFVFFGILLVACTPSQSEHAPELMRPLSARVDTAIVDRGTVAELTRHMGITRYISESIYFENPVGAFGRFYVNPGDIVEAGQLLAVLDTEQIEEQIAERTERLTTMRSDNTLANERRQVAIDIMIIESAEAFAASAENLDISAAEAAEARALDIEWAQMELRLERERQAVAIRHEEERLQALRERLNFAELYAPFGGIITYIGNIGRGQHLSPAQPLIYMSDRSETIIELVGLTGSDFPAPAGTGAPLAWRPFAVRDATITRAHINGQVYDLEFIVTAQEDRHFRPVQFNVVSGEVFPSGLLFPVYFYTVKVDDVVRIPSNAVFSSPEGFFVHRVINNELVHTEIEMITRTTTMVAVAEGLEVGDEIFVRP